MNISLNKVNYVFYLITMSISLYVLWLYITGQCIYKRIINSDYVYTMKYVVKYINFGCYLLLHDLLLQFP